MKDNKNYFFDDLPEVPFPYNQFDYPGIDNRATYDLSISLIAWLYGHLKCFEDICSDVVDLEFDKFNIGDDVLTLKQCIDRMIGDCRYILTNFDTARSHECAGFSELRDKEIDLFDILKDVFWFLWW